MPFLLDLHCHTRDHSHDGKMDAADLLKALRAAGFAGVTLTDHNYVWPAEELEELRRRAEMPADFVLLSGQEVRVSENDITIGDLLLYGLKDSYPDGTPVREVLAALKAQGGFAIAPHPGVPRKGLCEHVASYPLLAIETWNGRYGSKVARESAALARKHHMIAIGGSDSHRPEDVGGGGTMFERLPRTLPELAEMIRNGEARPWQPSLLQELKRYLRG